MRAALVARAQSSVEEAASSAIESGVGCNVNGGGGGGQLYMNMCVVCDDFHTINNKKAKKKRCGLPWYSETVAFCPSPQAVYAAKESITNVRMAAYMNFLLSDSKDWEGLEKVVKPLVWRAHIKAIKVEQRLNC